MVLKLSRHAWCLLVLLNVLVPPVLADEVVVREHVRRTIYHSPQSPGFTSWVGLWTMPDGSFMVCFTQATGPVNGRSAAPPGIQRRLGWPPAGIPVYDMTGLELRNVHLHSTDAGQTWRQVSADLFQSCMNGVTNEAATALADGLILRGVFGFYLPYNPELPQTGFVQVSRNRTQTWERPIVPVDATKYTTWPRRIRVLRDGRILLLAGITRLPVGTFTREEFSKVVQPALFISVDRGQTWKGPIVAIPQETQTGWTEEFDVAELENGDLLAIYRRASDEHRWQCVLRKSDGAWVAQKAGPTSLPQSGQPELLATREGPILHIATTGIYATKDAGQSWSTLVLPGSAYYPRSVQAKDGRILVVGHIGGDDGYGKVDQSIVMDTFRIMPPAAR